jgi:hypothetical protein
MLRRLGYPLIFLAMFSIAGGHWAVLQGVAWAGMVVEYSKASTVGAALVKTFRGEDPCDMCRTIEAGKQQERQRPMTVKADKKFDGFLIRARLDAPLPPEGRFSYPQVADPLVSARASAPPSPVPITA